MKNLKNLKLLSYALLLTLLVLCTEDDPIEFRLTTNCIPEKTGTVTPESGTFIEGTEIELKATANPEYLFKNWEGDAGGNENPLKITMTKDRQITAVFEKVKYALSIEIIGEGTVNQEVVVAKFSSTDYESGTTVELTAQPENGWKFVEWSGDVTGTENPVQISMDQAMSVSAKFERISYALTVEIEGNGEVKEEIVQNKISSSDYESGTTVLLTALPDKDWRFVEWKGDYEGEENPLELKMTKDRTLTAVFQKVDQLVSVEMVGQGNFTVEFVQIDPSPWNPSGIAVQLTAVANSGWYFVHWNGNIQENMEFFGDHIHTNDQIQIIPNDPINLTVLFQEGINDKTEIPDDNFEQALIDLGYDDVLDNYVSKREISQIEELNISDKNIESLSGLQDFVSLQHFNCSENKISEIDLSLNPEIFILNLNQNLISNLDISPLGYLLFFNASQNPLNCIEINDMQLEQSQMPGLSIWSYDDGVTLSLDCPD
ncbi:InlB B-repeat-containing protein [Lutimonas zeaxanthinifaciens]|uniref:InlB B-repeat-containing protein n=1 Tax=Lutimonas zeaxanthinifaciens TaxID=3060215 RepID=UPI00265CFD13|nr:hypothetical protein [Lutimonas sp. YSD2104]WKK66476.1 hypothetical protein QZH61_02375 [Lutimonas sp. YSD2104]